MPILQPDAPKYARMLAALLPRGRLWRLDVVLGKLLLGCADELVRISGRAAALGEEADPRSTSELLGEFEQELGLGGTGTEDERRAAIVAHLLTSLGFRPVDFQASLAPLLGLDADDVEVIEHDRAFAVAVGDDSEIFKFFVYRDPALAGTYDLDAAQAQLDRQKPSHTQGFVIESVDFLCDDEYSLCDRDVLGV